MATEAQKITKGALLRCSQQIALAVTAVANTDIAFTVPAGARDLAFTETTVTAFGAATDAQLSIGSAAGGAQYVALVTIKAAAKTTLSLVGAGLADLDTVPGAPGTLTTFYARIVQTGTASAVGAGVLNVSYSLPVA